MRERSHTGVAGRRRPIIAVVLGGGWRLGTSFHAGVLLALRDVSGIEADSVDSITGTSAGAVSAGFVGAGFESEDLFRREVGGAPSTAARRLLDQACTQEQQDEASASAIEEAVPKSVERYFDDLMDSRWPGQLSLRFCAMDTRNGRVAALDVHSGATPGRAVAASCSIPGIAHPVRIGDRAYIDGAVRSVNNAATVADTEPDIVIISAPMSVDRALFGFGPMTAIRNAVRVQTTRERHQLEHNSRVITIEPTSSDVAAMGSNLNDQTRREHVARHAYATACEILGHELPRESVGA